MSFCPFSFPSRKKRRKHSYDNDQLEAAELNRKGDGFDSAIIEGFDYEGRVVEGQERQECVPLFSINQRGGLSALGTVCSQDYNSFETFGSEIFQSIQQGNIIALIKHLEDYTADELSHLRFVGQPILHWICMKKDLKALEVVLSHNVQIDLISSDGMSALHLAVCLGWDEGVKVLLSKGAKTDVLPDIRSDRSWQEFPIHSACQRGNFAIACLLLDHQPDLSFTNNEQNLVLHLACYSHNFELVQELLENKIVKEMISFPNAKRNTPLHMLMMGENMDLDEEEITACVKLLLENGASINYTNEYGESPLFLAASANLPMVVKALLESTADPLFVRKDGRNVLHVACKAGSHESLSLILNTGKVSHLVLQVDQKGSVPFHLAVRSCSILCCELLLQNGDHLTNVDGHGLTRCALVLKNMPSSLQLLKNIFDKSVTISDNDTNDPEFKVQMDFNVLLSKTTEDIEASLIADLGSSYASPLLKHPLLESFLYLKWHKIKMFFYSYVVAYFVFLVIHTYYIIKTFNMATDWTYQQTILDAVHWLHVTLLIALVLPGIIIIFANVKKYVKQWESYFKIMALFTASFVVFTQESTLFSKEITRNVASVSIFFTWIEFMMLLGRFPSLGIYIFMFTKVSKSVLRFLLAFSPLIIAFALSFSILLKSVPTFDNFPTVFVRTLMMMLGEIEFSTIYESTLQEGKITMIVSQIFLVVFVILIPILMTNLLIGLAVSDLPDLQLQGKIRRLVKEASYLESYEKLMMFFRHVAPMPRKLTDVLLGKGSIKRKILIYPNQRHKEGSVTIPKDAINEAKISGLTERSKATIDLESSFINFYDEYQKDREQLEGALQTIYELLNQQIDQSTGDTVDGKSKNRKEIKSLINRKVKRFLAKS